MQIRELNLKELESIYCVLSQLYVSLSYDEFEDLVYDMRHVDYKMFGIMNGEILITYAGVVIGTNFYHKRHLVVFDFITDEKYEADRYGIMMLDYLKDYAKMAMCEKIVIQNYFSKNDEVYKKNGFEKLNGEFVKTI